MPAPAPRLLWFALAGTLLGLRHASKPGASDVHRQFVSGARAPIENIAEAVYILASGDPKTMTGRIDHATPFLKELGVEASKLV